MNNLPYTFFGSYDLDFKAEIIAAEMVEQGISADRILILLAGATKRPFSTDVTSVADELSEYDNKDYTIVQTTREGIYDMLPEGLFHQATAHKNAKSAEEIIKNIKQRRQEEVNARRFFLPFETAINFLRIQMAFYENRLDKRLDYDELLSIFSEHWEIFQYLDKRQADLFIYLIPILHDLRDDFAAIETILEMMLQSPVRISLQRTLPYQPPELIISTLGETTLGTNLTTGNLNYDEGTDEIHVNIDCSKKGMLQQFLPGTNNDKILQLLCDSLLPVNLDTIIILEPAATDQIIRLADNEGFYNSVLGADTWL